MGAPRRYPLTRGGLPGKTASKLLVPINLRPLTRGVEAPADAGRSAIGADFGPSSQIAGAGIGSTVLSCAGSMTLSVTTDGGMVADARENGRF